MHAGVLEREPLRPLALLLAGALSEGCLYIADADDPARARTEVLALITRMLSAFRVPPEGASRPATAPSPNLRSGRTGAATRHGRRCATGGTGDGRTRQQRTLGGGAWCGCEPPWSSSLPRPRPLRAATRSPRPFPSRPRPAAARPRGPTPTTTRRTRAWRPAPPSAAANLSRLATAWKVTASGGLPTSPIVVGHSVFVEDQVGEVFDIDLASGQRRLEVAVERLLRRPRGRRGRLGQGLRRHPHFALRARRDDRRAAVVDAADPHGDRRHRRAATGRRARGDRVDRAGERQGDLHRWRPRVHRRRRREHGQAAWGFDTVASPTLWGNPSVNSGGGSWYPPSFSPKSGLLYVGVANPAPFVGTTQYPNGTSRPGPNLYTDSTVALRIRTGQAGLVPPGHARTTSSIATSCTPWWCPVPAARGRPATTVVVGTGKGGFVIGMNPRTGAPALAHATSGVHENDTLKALTGPTEILPGTFGGVLTPPASAHGTVFVAALERARHAVPRTRPSTSAGRPGRCAGRWWR